MSIPLRGTVGAKRDGRMEKGRERLWEGGRESNKVGASLRGGGIDIGGLCQVLTPFPGLAALHRAA